jgi:hypothetical protein
MTDDQLHALLRFGYFAVLLVCITAILGGWRRKP